MQTTISLAIRAVNAEMRVDSKGQQFATVEIPVKPMAEDFVKAIETALPDLSEQAFRLFDKQALLSAIMRD